MEASPLVIESQPRDARGLSRQDSDALIVSIGKVGKKWLIISRYGDDCWSFRAKPTNAVQSNCILRFDVVPAPFRDVMRAVMYRYLRRGRSRGVRPGVLTMRLLLDRCAQFLRFLEKLKIARLRRATPAVCKMYVDIAKAELDSRGKRRAAGTLDGLFRAVEALHELSQYTDDPMPNHPWPETSAARLAGLQTSATKSRVGKTPLIPDEIFVALFQASWMLLDQAEYMLDLRDAIALLEQEKEGLAESAMFAAKRERLEELGWTEGVAALRSFMTDLRTACYIVIASLSGCRNHELAFLQTGACYRTEDDEGTIYWWMRSTSTKTGEGATEWMIPDAAVRAISIMERWAYPYQQEVADEIQHRRMKNPMDPEIAEAERHLQALFLGSALHKGQVRTLSNQSWNYLLRKFAVDRGIAWKLTSHQFRRTFANYAARSRFGDLRYLKEHFKHWSMDMTLGYALNDSQELALFCEIYDELDDIKVNVVESWLQPDQPLAGGYGARLARWRGSGAITLFRDRSAMIRAISDSTAIRANGHAWCTADDDLCPGNGGLDKGKCADCSSAVIGRQHGQVYQQMYEQLAELRSCNDIGPGGRSRVERDQNRCRSVLKSLGYSPVEVS
jgi:integrase